jgi:hypothetical protein
MNKINKALSNVAKARVADLTSLKKNHENFLSKNLNAYKTVAEDMKKADKAYVNASKTFENDGSVLNAHYLREKRAALDSCVSAFNVLTNNINSSMESLRSIYEQLNVAVKAVNAEKAAKEAEDFNKFNAKIAKTINKIKDSLAGYPHY